MLKIVTTADGSHTLVPVAGGEHYHSVNGAVQESQLVFLHNGFDYLAESQKYITVLEIGFGTGLNALLTVLQAKKTRILVHYVAIEPFPPEQSIIEQLNYPDIIGSPEAAGYFRKLHAAGWEYPSYLSDYFIINKLQANLEDITLQADKFNLVYFDAFSPETQPELWSQETFQKIASSMHQGAILVTYCSKGVVRRALANSGFTIEKLPGPAGKREVIRASKI